LSDTRGEKMKFILGLIFGILVVIFIFQNIEVVQINFLFWSISVSRALMVFLIFLIGIIVGAILKSFHIDRKKKTNKKN
jgi:uncharacterized integral membrane protein